MDPPTSQGQTKSTTFTSLIFQIFCLEPKLKEKVAQMQLYALAVLNGYVLYCSQGSGGEEGDAVRPEALASSSHSYSWKSLEREA